MMITNFKWEIVWLTVPSDEWLGMLYWHLLLLLSFVSALCALSTLTCLASLSITINLHLNPLFLPLISPTLLYRTSSSYLWYSLVILLLTRSIICSMHNTTGPDSLLLCPLHPNRSGRARARYPLPAPAADLCPAGLLSIRCKELPHTSGYYRHYSWHCRRCPSR